MPESENRQLVRMSGSGRISIPARQRRQLGLDGGGMVVTRIEDGELRIRPVRAVLAELQRKVGTLMAAAGIKPGTLLSDELVAERRAEAAREEQEHPAALKSRRASGS